MPIRALKIAVVVMGVLILVGTGTLVALLVRRAVAPLSTPTPVAASSVPRSPIPGDPPAANPIPAGPAFTSVTVLQEPEGTHIAGIAAVQDRLAVQLQGGGPDRVVFVDPRTLATAGSVRLAH